jgi:hypothetical protein
MEKTICSDSRLSDLDSQLNQSYKNLLSTSTNPDYLKSEQRSWLAAVRNKCKDVACLRQAYVDRIARLDGISVLATTPLSQAAVITSPKDQPSPNDTAVRASEQVEVSNPPLVQQAVTPASVLPKAETSKQTVAPTSSLPTVSNAAPPSTINPRVGITDVFHVLFAIGMLALIAGMVRPTLASKWITAPTRKKIFGIMLVYLIPVAALSNFTKTPERIAFDESVKKQRETERLEKELTVQKAREIERLEKMARVPKNMSPDESATRTSVRQQGSSHNKVMYIETASRVDVIIQKAKQSGNLDSGNCRNTISQYHEDVSKIINEYVGAGQPDMGYELAAANIRATWIDSIANNCNVRE